MSPAERTRLYHLPFTRDAASVVSRFLWKELHDLRVKVVLRAFQVRGSRVCCCCSLLSRFHFSSSSAMLAFPFGIFG